MKTRISLLVAAVASLASLALPARADQVLVFAAASLAGPLDRAAATWEAATGHEVTVSYAGSSALARQIEKGAPADVFLSASPGWVDHLAALARIENPTRRDLWRNRLALVSFAEGEPVIIDATLDLKGMLAGGRLAVALTQSVPAGIYASEALMNLQLWDGLRDTLAEADNVRAALALVASGAAPFGIVYASDVLAEPGVHERGLFPEDSHAPIIYPGAVIKGAGAPAHGFLDFLTTAEAQAIFAEAGFQQAPQQ